MTTTKRFGLNIIAVEVFEVKNGKSFNNIFCVCFKGSLISTSVGLKMTLKGSFPPKFADMSKKMQQAMKANLRIWKRPTTKVRGGNLGIFGFPIERVKGVAKTQILSL